MQLFYSVSEIKAMRLLCVGLRCIVHSSGGVLGGVERSMSDRDGRVVK